MPPPDQHHHNHAPLPLDQSPYARDIPIPSSVKGAPAHLRPVIRKRQNSESAKRSRQRRKVATNRFYDHFDQQCQRISALEKRVAQLNDLVKKKKALEAAAAAADAPTDRNVSDAPAEAPAPTDPDSTPTASGATPLPPATAPTQNVSAKQEFAPLHHTHPPEPAEDPVPERQEKLLLPVAHDKMDTDTVPPSVDILDHSLPVLHPPDLTSDAVTAFEHDIEVLLDSCVQMQHSFGDDFPLGSPFN